MPASRMMAAATRKAGFLNQKMGVRRGFVSTRAASRDRSWARSVSSFWGVTGLSGCDGARPSRASARKGSSRDARSNSCISRGESSPFRYFRTSASDQGVLWLSALFIGDDHGRVLSRLLPLHTNFKIAAAVLDMAAYFIPLHAGGRFYFFITFILQVE